MRGELEDVPGAVNALLGNSASIDGCAKKEFIRQEQ